MDWLAQIAPTIASCLGGPLAGMAVTALEKVLGVSGDQVQKVLDSGKLSGDQLVAIKQAEIEFQKSTQELGLNFEKLAVEDRGSARQMQINTKSFIVPTLACVIVGAFISMVGATLFGYSHIEGALAGSLVGYLSAKCEQVVAFYFGSSQGSQNKDQLLYNSTPKQNDEPK